MVAIRDRDTSRRRFRAWLRGSRNLEPMYTRVNPRILRSCMALYANRRLLDDYFIRKEECGGAVVKLHQVHASVQIIYFTQDAWLFTESAAPFVVAHRSLQL